MNSNQFICFICDDSLQGELRRPFFQRYAFSEDNLSAEHLLPKSEVYTKLNRNWSKVEVSFSKLPSRADNSNTHLILRITA